MTPTLRNRLLLATASLIITIGALELVGRQTISTPEVWHPSLEQDPILGWRLPVDTTIQWNGSPARINTLGLRGPEPQPEKTIKVLLMGDSSAFGDGVRDEETMATVLATLLSDDVDIQNAGVPGYTCWQSQLQLAQIRDHYEPHILISYHLHSDYRRAGPDDRVIAATALGPLAGTGIGRLISNASLRLRINDNGSNLSADQYRSCLESLVEEQQARGGRMAFVVPVLDNDFFPAPGTDPNPPGRQLRDYRNAMRSVATDSDSLLIEGKLAITAKQLSAGQAMLDPIHPSPKGHAALAQGIAKALIDAEWVD